MKDEIARSVHPIIVAGLDLKDRVSRNPQLDLVQEQAVLKGMLSRVADAPGDKVGSEGYLGIRYPLACWLDEIMILGTPWSSQWTDTKLETALFGTTDRAWMFWEQAEKAKGRQGSTALEVFFLCVVLGFQGKFRGQQAELESYIKTMRTQIANMQQLDTPQVASRGVPPTNVPWLTGRKQMEQMLLLASLELLLIIPILVFVLVRYITQ
jgi:type VI secretion system protein ImpK